MEGIRKRVKYKVPARATVYYIASTVIGRGIGVLTTPLFTRALDTEQFGAYSYYISLLSIVSLIGGAFLTPTIIYSGFGCFKDEKSKIKLSAVILSFAFSALICLVLFTFNDIIGIKKEFAILILIQALFDSSVNAELLSSKFSYDYTSVIALNLLSSFLSPIISLFLILRLGMKAMGRILGLLIAAGIVFLLVVFKNSKEISLPKKQHFTYLFVGTFSLLPSIIARASLGWSDKLIVKAALGSSALAKYSVAHTVGMALFGIIGALSSALNPWLIRKLASGKIKSTAPVIESLYELISFALIIVAGFGREILAFLAPADYLDSALVIVPFAISSAPYFAFGVISALLTYYRRGRAVSFAAIFGASLNLAVNVILISKIGILGGAISYLISETMVYLIAYRELHALETDMRKETHGIFDSGACNSESGDLDNDMRKEMLGDLENNMCKEALADFDNDMRKNVFADLNNDTRYDNTVGSGEGQGYADKPQALISKSLFKPRIFLFSASASLMLSCFYKSLAIRLILMIFPALLLTRCVLECLSLIRESKETDEKTE